MEIESQFQCLELKTIGVHVYLNHLNNCITPNENRENLDLKNKSIFLFYIIILFYLSFWELFQKHLLLLVISWQPQTSQHKYLLLLCLNPFEKSLAGMYIIWHHHISSRISLYLYHVFDPRMYEISSFVPGED